MLVCAARAHKKAPNPEREQDRQQHRSERWARWQIAPALPTIPASAAQPPGPSSPSHVMVALVPAHTSALLGATALPQSCSRCICFGASVGRQRGVGPAAYPAGAGDTTHIVPAPPATTELRFSARSHAQICCHPSRAGKQQPQNGLTAPEQKLDSLFFPLSFHQIDANWWQCDRSGRVLLARSAKVDAKCAALTEGPCTTTGGAGNTPSTSSWQQSVKKPEA